tara:strand:+ start:23 stop:565 length:543 start_codon:yes stop_codon:yes gene_type:complete
MIFKITIKLALLLFLFSSRISYSQNLIFENIVDTIISMDYTGYTALNNADNPFEIEINVPENKIWKIKNIILTTNHESNDPSSTYYYTSSGNYTYGLECYDFYMAAKVSNSAESSTIFTSDWHPNCDYYFNRRKSDDLDIWVKGANSKSLIFGVYPREPQYVLPYFNGSVFFSIQQYYID